MRKRFFNRQENHYAFEVRARIEPNENEESSPPMRVDLWIEAGVETGRGSKEDRLQLVEVVTVPSDLRVERFGNGKTRVHVPAYRNPMQIQISGATEDLSPSLLSLTEGELRARIERVEEPEEVEELATGERADAES